MEQGVTNKKKSKRALAIIGCAVFVLACVLIIVFMKLPMVKICDGGCNIGELGWTSIADIIANAGPDIINYLYTIPLLLVIEALAGLSYYPGLVILFTAIMILLIVMSIIAIVKTMKYCKR